MGRDEPVEPLADLLGDPLRALVVRMDERDGPSRADLAEHPVASCERCLRRVPMTPRMPRKRPSELDLSTVADLRARPALPDPRVPRERADAAEDGAVLLPHDHEAPEAVDAPAEEHPVDLLDSIRALGRLAAADEAHDLRVAERLQQIVDIAGLREPEQEPVGLEHAD